MSGSEGREGAFLQACGPTCPYFLETTGDRTACFYRPYSTGGRAKYAMRNVERGDPCDVGAGRGLASIVRKLEREYVACGERVREWEGRRQDVGKALRQALSLVLREEDS